MLWRYARASMGLVAYFPPICDPADGHYLLDGGYTNLVPGKEIPPTCPTLIKVIPRILISSSQSDFGFTANIMREFGARYIIAIDVSSEEDKVVTNYGKNKRFILRIPISNAECRSYSSFLVFR
jgi:lysophospholipid hydrolase